MYPIVRAERMRRKAAFGASFFLHTNVLPIKLFYMISVDLAAFIIVAAVGIAGVSDLRAVRRKLLLT